MSISYNTIRKNKELNRYFEPELNDMEDDTEKTQEVGENESGTISNR